MDSSVIKVIELCGRKYLLLDILSTSEVNYYYFSAMDRDDDIVIFVSKGNSDYLVRLVNEEDIEFAMNLFYERHRSFCDGLC